MGEGRAMEMSLRSKNKMVFVDGTMEIPSRTDVRYFYWDQCNTMVLSRILRAVSPTIGRSVLWINTAEGIWKDLKKRFSQQDVFRIAEIQAEIYQIKQGNSSVNDYITHLKLLWDELSVLRPTPSCECSPRCECGRKLAEKSRVYLENDMLSAFLIGLNENFSNTKRQIMLMKPLPDVGEAFAMVSQQERQVTDEQGNLGESLSRASAFFTKYENSSKRSFSGQKQKPVCSYCGYTGHTIDKCYKKHGYPPGWKRNKNSGAVNQVQAAVQGDDSPQTIPSMHQEDFRRFLEFMKYEKANNSSPLSDNSICSPQANAIAASFVPDSNWKVNRLIFGATHHIFCDVSLLHNPKEVKGVLVDLPNGNQAQVSHIGTAQLSADMDQHHGKMIDIWRPYHTPTVYGHQYFLTLVDDYSRATWIYLMRKKSEVRQILQTFCELANAQFGRQVKCIRYHWSAGLDVKTQLLAEESFNISILLSDRFL
ncbi:PREDICTED: uncharacterized protein LOC109167527 [Ipomoea nil]|uniref:uncharacterized protein LOC109167527 n=1 Tax=Ipomoea nil TaxID=35883 RepID=UPI000900DCFB|nr:PREDICTED: uncharacterized protein LOC109167527 [Ipomoea nil]